MTSEENWPTEPVDPVVETSPPGPGNGLDLGSGADIWPEKHEGEKDRVPSTSRPTEPVDHVVETTSPPVLGSGAESEKDGVPRIKWGVDTDAVIRARCAVIMGYRYPDSLMSVDYYSCQDYLRFFPVAGKNSRPTHQPPTQQQGPVSS